MVFKAKNTGAYISIDGKQTQIENLTGQNTPSDGIVIISQEKAIYIPNALQDFKDILEQMDKLASQVLAVNTALKGSASLPDANVIIQIPIIQASLSQIKAGLK